MPVAMPTTVFMPFRWPNNAAWKSPATQTPRTDPRRSGHGPRLRPLRSQPGPERWAAAATAPPPLDVAAETGPLSALAGRDVLVLADAQNLDSGARDLGCRVDWTELGRKLDAPARTTSRHVFISEPAGRDGRAASLAAGGWTPHRKVTRFVRTIRGTERTSNTDNLIAFFAGVLVSRSRADLILVCSGDGTLVEDVAEAVKLLPYPRAVATLSLAGSTAARLDAAFSPFVTANLEVGQDCLLP